jgi:exosortase
MIPTGTEYAPKASLRRTPPVHAGALASGRRWQNAALVLACAAVAWSYLPDFLELFARWRGDPQYSHGFLVPVFAAAILWLRRGEHPDVVFRPSAWGLPCVALALVVRLAGAYFYWTWVEQVSLVPLFAGLALTLGGWPALRWAWPAVLFTVFMVPLPGRVEGYLGRPLQRGAAVACTFVFQLLGFPAQAEGNVILLRETELEVVEACSGLRMLVMFAAVCSAVAMVSRRPWMERVLILVSAVPIAIFANIVRITVTGVLHETVNSEVANFVFHDVAGWLMMVLALGLLWLELKFFGRLFVYPSAPASERELLGLERPGVPALV